MVTGENQEHTFSVEISSKMHVKQIAISSDPPHLVLFEGSLGKLEELSLVEGAMLEIKGTKGVLRIDLTESELRKVFAETTDISEK